MALNLPTISSTVKDRLKIDIQTLLSLSNPFLKGSWLRAFAESIGERIFDFYSSIAQAIEEVFPDTTTTNLDRWASLRNLSRLAATRSTGNVTFQASVDATTLPLGHKVVDSNGNTFETTQSVNAELKTVNQTTLTKVGTIATFSCDSDHFLNAGDEVTIANAVDDGFNGTVVVTPIANDVFTYVIGASGSSTTGAEFDVIGNTAPVQSDDTGDNQNLDQFTALTLQSPITNVFDECGVDGIAFAGGGNQETDESFRSRVLDVIRNPVAHFNVSDITRVSLAVALVTRVFVEEVTPDFGQVTIYPMVDNESSPIPDSGVVASVKSAILLIKPATTSDDDVIVTAPTEVDTDFTFTALSPNTPTMQTSIRQGLLQFFAQSAEVGVDVTEDAYRSAIFSTVDTETGDPVASFSLSAPSGDIIVDPGKIATLGALVFLP